MTVKWKRGTGFKSEPEKAHEVLEKLRKDNGGQLLAENVVKEAQKPTCPINDDFEWRDDVAAHEHRKFTARKMAASLVVVREDTKTQRPQRVYEVVRTPQNPRQQGRQPQAYRSVDDIMKDKDLRAELLGRALRELISIRSRYRDLQELAVVMRAIDELVESA